MSLLDGTLKYEGFSAEVMQQLIAGSVIVQDELRKDVFERVCAAYERKRVAASDRSRSELEVGGYVSEVRIRKLGNTPKLVTTWTGPWRGVSGGSPLVCVVQDLVIGETKKFQVVQMRAYTYGVFSCCGRCGSGNV